MILSADEARKISGPSVADQVNEHLKFIDAKIRKAAERKQRFVIIRDEPYARWLYRTSHDSPDEVADLTVSNLIAAGYEVTLHYVELQFVDLGLHISWG